MILAADIDGTFYFSKDTHPYRQEDLKAIEQWQKEGRLFGICTGRSEDSASIVLGDTVHPDFHIMTNGALVRKGDKSILLSAKLEKAFVEGFLEEFKVYHPTFTSRKEKQLRFHSMEEYDGGEIESMSFYFPEESEASDLFPRVESFCKNKANVFLNTHHVDIAPLGIDKGNAAKLIGTHYKDKVAGIGDTYCDIPLLEASDISFTFKSSPKEVQAKADYLVDTLAEAIEILKDLG